MGLEVQFFEQQDKATVSVNIDFFIFYDEFIRIF